MSARVQGSCRVLCGALLAAHLVQLAQPARAQDDELSDLEESEPVEANTQEGSENESAGESSDEASSFEAAPEAPSDELEEPEAALEPSYDQALEPDAESTGSAEARALGFRATLGLGMGTLAYTRPSPEGTQRLGETPFAAAGLELALTFSPRDPFAIEALFAYQSSIAFALRLEPLFALPERVSVRYQRMELGAAPLFRLGESAESLTLAVPVGIAYRAFLPETHQYERLEKYVMAGLFLRPELLAWLGERVKLRMGPELQWIGYVEADFAGGSACCQGIAAAGQAAIEARVGSILSVSLRYREAHAFVSSSRRFEDIERWLLAQITGAF